MDAPSAFRATLSHDCELATSWTAHDTCHSTATSHSADPAVDAIASTSSAVHPPSTARRFAFPGTSSGPHTRSSAGSGSCYRPEARRAPGNTSSTRIAPSVHCAEPVVPGPRIQGSILASRRSKFFLNIVLTPADVIQSSHGTAYLRTAQSFQHVLPRVADVEEISVVVIPLWPCPRERTLSRRCRR